MALTDASKHDKQALLHIPRHQQVGHGVAAQRDWW